jgi:hypothetical protein
LIADAVGPWVFSLVVVVVVALLVFWLVRDRTSSLRFGIFLEHRREPRERADDENAPTEIIEKKWPGESK